MIRGIGHVLFSTYSQTWNFLMVSRTWLCPFLWAYGHILPFSIHLCERIVLVARSLPKICPQILEHKHKGYAHEVQNGPFLSRFFTVAVVHFVKCARCASVTRISGSSVKSTWMSATLCPGIRNPIASNSSMRQQILSHHFSSAVCWADCQPQRAWIRNFRRFCIPIQICNFQHTGRCQ